MPAADFSNQIHDFDPGFGEAGLFWTIPISRHSISADADKGRASFHIKNLRITDYHNIPNGLFHFAPPDHATVTFDVEWSGVVSRSHLQDAANQLRGNFATTGTRVRWSAKEGGRTVFTSDDSGQTTVFSQVGTEANGVFFSEDGAED